MSKVFDLTKFAKEHSGGRTPIKERGITWEESYEGKTASLKENFEKKVGPGAYYRWEGYDSTTDSMYYVIVGPSEHKGMGKVFFAGIKRVPKIAKEKTKTYSPYGEYFKTIKAALGYVSDRWGVPIPKDTPNYSDTDLLPVDIPKHVKD